MNNTPYQDLTKTITSPEFQQMAPHQRLPVLGQAFKAAVEQSEPYRNALEVAGNDPVAVQKINLAATQAFKKKYAPAFEVVVNPGTENPAYKQWQEDKKLNPTLPDDEAPKQFLGREVRTLKSPAQEMELLAIQSQIKTGGNAANGYRPLKTFSPSELKYVNEVYGSEDSYMKRQVQLELLARQQGVASIGDVDTSFVDQTPELAAAGEYLKGVVRGGVVTPYLTIRKTTAAALGGVVGMFDKRAGRIAAGAYKDEDTVANRSNPFATVFDTELSAAASGTSAMNATAGSLIGTFAGFATGGAALNKAGEVFGAKTLTNTLVQSAVMGNLFDTGDLIFNTTGEEEGLANQAKHQVGTVATNIAFDLLLKGIFTTAVATIKSAKTVVQTGEKAPLLQKMMDTAGGKAKAFGQAFGDEVVTGWVNRKSYVKAAEKLAQLTEKGVVDGVEVYTRTAPRNPIEVMQEAARPTFKPLSKWTPEMVTGLEKRTSAAPLVGLEEDKIVENLTYLRSWRMDMMTKGVEKMPILKTAKSIDEIAQLYAKEGKNMSPVERSLAERLIATSKLEQETKAALVARQRNATKLDKSIDGADPTDYEKRLERILDDKTSDFGAMRTKVAADRKAAEAAAAKPEVPPAANDAFEKAQDVLFNQGPKQTDEQIMAAVSTELTQATKIMKAARSKADKAEAKEILTAAFEKHQRTEVELLRKRLAGVKSYEEAAALITDLQKRFDKEYLAKHGNKLPEFLKPIAKEQRKAVADLFTEVTRKGEAKLTTEYRVGTQYAIKSQTEALTDALNEKNRIILALRDKAVGSPERRALVEQLAENEEYLRAATEGKQTLVDMTGDLAKATPESIDKTLALLDGVLPTEQVDELRRLSQSVADKRFAAENADVLLAAREKQAQEFNLNKESEKLKAYWTEQNAKAEARTTADLEQEASLAEARRFEKDLADKDALLAEMKKSIEDELGPYFEAEKAVAEANKTAATKPVAKVKLPEAGGKTKIRLASREKDPIYAEGKVVDVSEGVRGVIHRSASGESWIISEYSSGLAMASGKTQKAALAELERRIGHVGKEKLLMAIDRADKLNGTPEGTEAIKKELAKEGKEAKRKETLGKAVKNLSENPSTTDTQPYIIRPKK